jgi:hypothetical protein
MWYMSIFPTYRYIGLVLSVVNVHGSDDRLGSLLIALMVQSFHGKHN